MGNVPVWIQERMFICTKGPVETYKEVNMIFIGPPVQCTGHKNEGHVRRNSSDLCSATISMIGWKKSTSERLMSAGRTEPVTTTYGVFQLLRRGQWEVWSKKGVDIHQLLKFPGCICVRGPTGQRDHPR